MINESTAESRRIRQFGQNCRRWIRHFARKCAGYDLAFRTFSGQEKARCRRLDRTGAGAAAAHVTGLIRGAGLF